MSPHVSVSISMKRKGRREERRGEDGPLLEVTDWQLESTSPGEIKLDPWPQGERVQISILICGMDCALVSY